MSRPIHTDTRVLRPIIEALIFASEEPLPPRLLVRLLAGERDDPKSASLEEAATDVVEADATVDSDAISDTDATDDSDAADDSDATDETAFPEEAVVDAGADEVSADDVPQPAGEGWLEQEIGVDANGSATAHMGASDAGARADDAADGEEPLADGSESADALATAYVDLSRDYSERLFPEEQIVTIDQRLVRRLIEDLNAEYEETSRAFRIVEVAGGFQYATIREFGEYVALLSKEKQRRRLSPAALETLAIIAFRQPISKPEIEAIRGVNSDQVLLSLLEKNLVAITGRSESVGRPLLYGTTDEFLRIFGLNSLNELPKLREIEELMEEDAYSAERIEVVNVDPTSDAEQIEAMVGAAGHEERAEVGEVREESELLADDGIAEAALRDEDPNEAGVAADLEELAESFDPAPGDADGVELEEAIADPDGESDETDEVPLGDRSDYELDSDVDTDGERDA